MQTPARTPTFSGLLMIYLRKNRALFARRDETSAGRGVIWALLWGLCSVDENILVFKASCWELCAYLHNSHPNIRPFLIRQMQTSACRGQTGYVQQAKAHQRHTLFIKHSAEPKAKTVRAKCFSAPGSNFHQTFRKKTKVDSESSETDGTVMCSLCVFGFALLWSVTHRSTSGFHRDPSQRRMGDRRG